MLEYTSAASALLALSWHGEVINNTMIGVKPTEVHELSHIDAMTCLYNYNHSSSDDDTTTASSATHDDQDSSSGTFDIRRTCITGRSAKNRTVTADDQPRRRESFCSKLFKFLSE